MKFLLDVCVSSRSLTAYLVADGHDVVSALTIDPQASDARLLQIARQDERVLITADKDFGELIHVQSLSHGPVVRIVDLALDEQISAIQELLDRPTQELTGPVMVTITRGRIRIRRRES